MATPPMAAAVGADKSVFSVEDSVKRLVARELHDRVAQTLTGMLIDVENFKTEQVAWDDVIDQLNTIQDSTRQVLRSLRQLLHDLRGDEAAGSKFLDGIATLAARFEAKTGITVQVSTAPEWPASLNPAAAVNLYRVVEEALTNVHRHSGARIAGIAFQAQGTRDLSVSISDDGRGFDSELSSLGMGSMGMKERVLLLGGRLRIESAPGKGTEVQATFPRDQVIDVAAEPNVHSDHSRLEPKEISA